MIQKSPEKNRKNPLKPAKNRLKILKIDYNFRSKFFISDMTEKQLEILTESMEKKVYTSSLHGRIDSASYCLK